MPNTTTYVADEVGQSFVVAGSGTYNFVGGDGNLTVWEGPGGNASVAAGNGNDLLGFNAGSSYVVAAGNGNDTFVANGSGTIYTGIGNNLIFSDPAGPNGNFIFSHGHDTISAATGPTTVATYGYAPEIFGGSDPCWCMAIRQSLKTVAAGSGATTIFSATSGTYFMGTGNTNEFIGSPGSASTVVGSTGSETVFGGPNGSEDVFANSSSLIFAGSSGDSATITGGTSQVTLFGAAGSAETLLGSSGWFFAAGGGKRNAQRVRLQWQQSDVRREVFGRRRSQHLHGWRGLATTRSLQEVARIHWRGVLGTTSSNSPRALSAAPTSSPTSPTTTW